MRTRLAAGLLLAAWLAGCAVGPNYKRPRINAPAQWVSPLEGGETNLPAPEARWWNSFADAELDSLIARSVKSNLDLTVARARVREARAGLRFASGGLGPTLNTSASYAEERYPANGFPPFPPIGNLPLEDNVYQVGFDAAWALDVFGGVRRAVEAARAEAAAAEFGRRDLLITICGEVARNYIDARASQRRLAVALENIKTQEKTLALTRDLRDHGLTSDLDVQQAASLLATTQAETPSLETGFKSAAYRLATLLGQPPGALLEELSGQPPAPITPPAVPVGLPSDLLERRPDVAQAERQLAAATARVGVATADLFPKFSLTGDVGLQSVSASQWFTQGSRYWSAGPAVQWRIFDSGRIRANIRVQDARQQQALAHYEQTALNAFEEVERALTAYSKEQVRRESLQTAVAASQKGLDLASQLYAHCLTDFLRVLESQRALYQSQDAVIESDRAVSADLIALYKALGGGWAVAP
jgi:outer membrane protein, multidrug efflux system